MTERLFEKNPYLKTFNARVVECIEKKGIFCIRLDRTAFFPEGGGQPGDRGVISDAIISDTHEKDGYIWHYADRMLEAGSEVVGTLDWAFRFSNMQNHAGEHIVSGIIHRKYGYDNVGFHMGSEAITLDINGELSAEQILEIEREANEAIEANVPIQITIPDKKSLDTMNYRSKKELSGDVRIVEIPGYDLCACCGTHPFRTGEIRIIKLLSVQNYKGGVRISMLAGNRAFLDYSKKHDSVVEISHLLSAKTCEVSDAVERLLKEIGDLKFSMVQMKREMMQIKASHIMADKDVICIFESQFKGNDLREYANLIAEHVNRVLLLCEGGDDQFRYVLIDHKNQARVLGKELQQIYGAKGGGTPQMVQGTLKGNWAEIKKWFENHE